MLTSAKCVDDKLLGGVHNPEIWINSIDLSFLNTTSVVIRGVNETIFHPEYIIDPSSGNNIALLVLDEAVTEVSAIRLGEDEVLRSNELGLDEGSIIYFLGYGGTAGTSSYSSVLIRGTWSLEPDSLCLNYITGDYNSVIMNCGIGSSPCYGNFFLFKKKINIMAFIGDMGGPVFWNSPGEDSADQDALIGILSVLDCGDEVSSYLDISGHFYDWVYEMRNNISARYEDSGSTELSPEEIAARLAELYEYYGVDLVNDGDEDYSALGSYFSEEENG